MVSSRFFTANALALHSLYFFILNYAFLFLITYKNSRCICPTGSLLPVLVSGRFRGIRPIFALVSVTVMGKCRAAENTSVSMCVASFYFLLSLSMIFFSSSSFLPLSLTLSL